MSELLYQEKNDSNIINNNSKNLIDSINNELINKDKNNNLDIVLDNVLNDNKKNYKDLERIRKHIETLSTIHHIEIARIFKNNNIKLTENNNGLFVNLNNIDSSIIDEIQNYLNFVNLQENNINDIEDIKKDLEKNFF